jgi:hypothetical protein
MHPSSAPSELKTVKRPKRVSALAAPLLLTAAIVGVIASGVYVANILPAHVQGDHVSAEQQQQRQAAFDSLGSLQMLPVSPNDAVAAVDAMQLAPDAKRSLLADLATPLPLPSKNAAPANRLRLAWITLWDTDVEDGDVVRIDSQGYSRTVVLKKRPTTFAVPVPADGVIHVAGIRDGDGGGITVGLASGAYKAVFPVMSEGQVLDLRVKVP